jgi:transcriptional regulator with XRE-family HTH domain
MDFEGQVRAAARVLAGQNQSDLAEAMGVATSTVSSMERGEVGAATYTRADEALRRLGVHISIGDAVVTLTLVRAQTPASPESNREDLLKEEAMSEIDMEVYKTAKILSPNGEVFTRQEFFETYLTKVNPQRNPTSILPADYVDSRDPITHELLNPSVRFKPKFLERVKGERGKYRRIK